MTIPEPLSNRTWHCVVDMQRLFAENTDWHTPDLAGILPNVVALCEARRERTLFARFRPRPAPRRLGDAGEPITAAGGP